VSGKPKAKRQVRREDTQNTERPCGNVIQNILCSLLLRYLQVIQAFFLDESFYTEDEWHDLITGFTGALDDDEGFFPGLIRTARLFQRTRRLLTQGPISPNEKEELIASASDLHDTISDRISNWSRRLHEVRDLWLLDINSRKHKFDHGSCVREYGLAMCTQVQVNCLLAALSGEVTEAIESENTMLCRGMYTLCEVDALCHRPLGTCWVMIAMSTAYIGATNAKDKARVMKIISDYTHDLPRESTEVVYEQMDGLARHLTCGDILPGLFTAHQKTVDYVYYDCPGLESGF
jgi:hypothetical protein